MARIRIKDFIKTLRKPEKRREFRKFGEIYEITYGPIISSEKMRNLIRLYKVEDKRNLIIEDFDKKYSWMDNILPQLEVPATIKNKKHETIEDKLSTFTKALKKIPKQREDIEYVREIWERNVKKIESDKDAYEFLRAYVNPTVRESLKAAYKTKSKH